MRTDAPNDIDLALIYLTGTTLEELVAYRSALSATIMLRFGLKADFCVFSKNEAKTNSFFADEGVVMLD